MTVHQGGDLVAEEAAHLRLLGSEGKDKRARVPTSHRPDFLPLGPSPQGFLHLPIVLQAGALDTYPDHSSRLKGVQTSVAAVPQLICRTWHVCTGGKGSLPGRAASCFLLSQPGVGYPGSILQLAREFP